MRRQFLVSERLFVVDGKGCVIGWVEKNSGCLLWLCFGRAAGVVLNDAAAEHTPRPVKAYARCVMDM
jgi:hypothetical protein